MRVRAPDSLLMLYEAKLPDADPAAKTNLPAGSRLKALGTGSVGTCPIVANAPVEGSTVKPAMLL